MALDRRLIESGLWRDVQVELKAASGSELVVRGDAAGKMKVGDWIRTIAVNGFSAEEFGWAREAAIHHLAQMRPDLQSLVWQRDKSEVFSDVTAVTAAQVQNVVKIYFP
jgi:hypothetical protein